MDRLARFDLLPVIIDELAMDELNMEEPVSDVDDEEMEERADKGDC